MNEKWECTFFKGRIEIGNASAIWGDFKHAFFVCLFLALAVFLSMDKVWMPLVAGKFKGVVEVPPLRGMDVETSKVELEGRSLELVLDSMAEYSPEMETGLVLKQRPLPNSRVKKGRRIWVTVSKGLKEVAVPDLKGNSIRQAEILLQQAGLSIGDMELVNRRGVPAGVVLATQPLAEEEIEAGSPVDLMVSSGGRVQPGKMKDLRGLSIEKAKHWVMESDLRLDPPTFKFDSTLLPNTVMEQSPMAGAKIITTQSVRLTVAKREGK